jgi:hypothetical protein
MRTANISGVGACCTVVKGFGLVDLCASSSSFPSGYADDEVLVDYCLVRRSGLKRCGKSCRLRWLNYLRPELRHGGFTDEEDSLILSLYGEIGSKYDACVRALSVACGVVLGRGPRAG